MTRDAPATRSATLGERLVRNRSERRAVSIEVILPNSVETDQHDVSRHNITTEKFDKYVAVATEAPPLMETSRQDSFPGAT